MEYEWLGFVHFTDGIVNDNVVSWSSYHSSRNRGTNVCVSVISLMPLLQESAHSVATIKHSMGPIGSKSRVLPVFHPLTGCDTRSAFVGKGNKSAWQACGMFMKLQ